MNSRRLIVTYSVPVVFEVPEDFQITGEIVGKSKFCACGAQLEETSS